MKLHPYKERLPYPIFSDMVFLIPRMRYYRITAKAMLHGRFNIDQFILFTVVSVLMLGFLMAMITIEMTF
jgi:hypothetical protein